MKKVFYTPRPVDKHSTVNTVAIEYMPEQKWINVQLFRIDSYTAAYFCKPIA